jgi:hypothetical protein
VIKPRLPLLTEVIMKISKQNLTVGMRKKKLALRLKARMIQVL